MKAPADVRDAIDTIREWVDNAPLGESDFREISQPLTDIENAIECAVPQRGKKRSKP